MTTQTNFSEKLYGCNPCGEGGEYETFTLDAPIYKKRIVMLLFLFKIILSDDAQIICHLYDRDAPVYLYVPQKWHLEEKEKQEIDIENSQSILTPGIVNESRLLHSTEDPLFPLNLIPNQPTSLTQSSLWENLIDPSIDSFPSLPSIDSFTSTKGVTSIEIVTNNNDFKSLLKEYTNPPLLYLFPFYFISRRVVYSSYCTHPLVKKYYHHNVHNQTWYSRSIWCPPALYAYSMILSSSNAFSIPMILPIESDSLEYTCISLKSAYSLVYILYFIFIM